MKINVIIDNTSDEEVIIKSKVQDERISKIIDFINSLDDNKEIILFNNKDQFVFNVQEIYFFETENDVVYAHFQNRDFISKLRLYELEKILPSNFIRISKSTILNINFLAAIKRTLGAPSIISLKNTHKEVFVSRSYYKNLNEHIRKRSLL